MPYTDFGDRLQILRKEKGFSQKEFAEFLGIPQPTMSAYENNRNAPSMDVLVKIAKSCNASLDWLCGISPARNSVSSLSDLSELFYSLFELNEIGGEIEIHDKLQNDTESGEDKWYTRITFYGNEPKYKFNADLCNILREVKENVQDLETYRMSTDMYEVAKERTKEYYANLPLTKKEFPALSREELLKKHMEYLKSAYPDKD